MGSTTRKGLVVYVALVSAIGLAALVLGIVGDLDNLLWSHLGQFVVFTPLVVLGEMVPIRVPRGDDYRELRASKSFAFALLLMAGPAAALIAMALASIVSDAQQHTPASRRLFDVGRHSIGLVFAAAILQSTGVGSLPVSSVALADLGIYLVAGTAFFSVDAGLGAIGGVLGDRRRGRRAFAMLFDDLLFRVGAALTLISVAPLIAAATANSPILVVLLVGPVHRDAPVGRGVGAHVARGPARPPHPSREPRAAVPHAGAQVRRGDRAVGTRSRSGCSISTGSRK